MKIAYASATVYILSIVSVFPAQSSASELLATYYEHGEAGIAPQADQSITFDLGLTSWGSLVPETQLNAGVFWNEGDSGTVDFTEETTPGFSDFAELATNGILDQYWAMYYWPDGQGGGGGSAESWLLHQHNHFPEQPDLVGYELDRVRMIVDGIDFEPWTPEPGSSGYMVEWDVTFQFFGVAVPEPGVLNILGICTAALLKKQK